MLPWSLRTVVQLAIQMDRISVWGVSPDPVEGAAGKTVATETPVTSQTATGLLVCELFFPPVYPTPKVFQHSVHECLCYSALLL